MFFEVCFDIVTIDLFFSVQDKFELRRDVQSLLNCILTMQKLAHISTGNITEEYN